MLRGVCPDPVVLIDSRKGLSHGCESAAKAKIGVLGASGYTGSELVRLLLRHPQRRDRAAHRRPPGRAGDARRCFRSSRRSSCRRWSRSRASTGRRPALDLVFCALPHATTQKVIKDLLGKAPKTKVVDLSADFRLHDTGGLREVVRPRASRARSCSSEAVYGLVEVYRDEIRKARLVANPGCYTSCAQLAADPAAQGQGDRARRDRDRRQVRHDRGGRAAKEEMLFSEVSEGFHAYGVGHHRHMAELDQEFSLAAGPRGDRDASRRIWCR